MSIVSQVPAVLDIRGKPYEVNALDPHEEGTVAYRLCKSDGEVYDLVRRFDGTIECTCSHYEFTLRGNTRTPCKHGAALVAAGLVPAPGVDVLLAGSPLSDRDIWVNGPRVDGLSAAADALAGCRIDPADGLPVAVDDAPADGCDDEEGGSWDEWGDDRIALADDPSAEPEPEPIPPGEPRLPLGEWVRAQASWYRSFGTEAADLMATLIDEAAAEVEFLHAASPGAYRDRREALLCHREFTARIDLIELTAERTGRYPHDGPAWEPSGR